MSQEAQDFGGSIGSTWPPQYDEDNRRIKGFQTRVVSSPDIFNESLDELERLMEENSQAERITCRFIVDNDIQLPDRDGRIEAEIPLDGRWDGHNLIYYGRNNERRTPPEDEVRVEDEYIDVALEREPQSELDRVRENGFDLEVDPEPTGGYIREMQELYNTVYSDYPFDFTEENVMDFFDNHVVLGWDDERLVSSYVGEVAEIPLDTGTARQEFAMAELSDAATYEEYGGEGLFVASGELLLEALKEEGVDLVYGEARASSVPVNVGSRKMGREYAGRLPKHCKIGGRTDYQESGEFENLNVWHITREGLNDRF